MTRGNLIALLSFALLFLLVFIGALGIFLFRDDRAGMNLRAEAHTGEVVQMSEMPGELRLVYFGFMNCPDVCLDAALSIGSTLKTLEAQAPDARAAVSNVFVTLDPDDDVIAGVYNELGGYMDSRYGGQGYALRPASRAEAQRMASAFGVRFEYVEDDFFPSGYRVDHASLIFLTDQNGKVLTYYADRTPGVVIAQDIERYLTQAS